MTMYEQLGGTAAVAALLDGLYARALDDPLLKPFLENLDIERLKQQQFAFLSQAMGGPDRYTGPSLKAAHARLRVENRHFDAFVGHVRVILKQLGATDNLSAEILLRVTSVRAEIVNTATVNA